MPIFLLIIISSPFLFYKLGQSSLVPFDEAWYAEVAKNIIKTGEMFILHFNGKPFFDHPPFGFWLISLGQRIFGFNEFGTRVPSAIFGLLTIIFTYLLGKKIFGRIAGFFAGLALVSAPWFLSRARSGNLDIFLTGLFVLVIYLAFKSLENKKYLISLSFALSFLFLTKTMVPFTILPALLIIFWGNKQIKIKDFIRPMIIFIALGGYWVYQNYILNPNLFFKNYLKIGLTGVNVKVDYLNSLILIKTYAHNGIGTWFRAAVLGLAGGLILIRSKSFFILAVLISSILLPFLFSNKGHIWHMIPVYPFLLLGLFGFIDSFFKKFKMNHLFKGVVMFIVFLALFVPQSRRNWSEFIDIPAYVSDEAILSREAGKYKEDFILDDDFVPSAVFYSDKKVERTVTDLKTYFKSDRKFLMLVRDYKLNAEDIRPDEYVVLMKDRDKLLIRKI